MQKLSVYLGLLTTSNQFNSSSKNVGFSRQSVPLECFWLSVLLITYPYKTIEVYNRICKVLFFTSPKEVKEAKPNKLSSHLFFFCIIKKGSQEQQLSMSNLDFHIFWVAAAWLTMAYGS